MVMNLDFTKPRGKALEMATEMNIDLNNSGVIDEIKKIQKQKLEELRATLRSKQYPKIDQLADSAKININ